MLKALKYLANLRNSYTMGCLPVRGINPRALASGFPYVQVDKHRVLPVLFYTCTTYICVDPAHDEIFRAKVGKGGQLFFNIWYGWVSGIFWK